MRITRSLLEQRVSRLNEAGAALAITRTNGWYNLCNNDGSRSFMSGTASEVYNFLAGVFAVYYQNIKFV